MMNPLLSYLIASTITAVIGVLGFAWLSGQALWGWPVVHAALIVLAFILVIAGIRLYSWWRFDYRGNHGQKA